MASELLDCIEIDPVGHPVATIIWLHGLGADGHDFEPIVPELRLPDTLPVRFVFPHAPMRSVTINGGMVMRAWYDILDMGRNISLEDFEESTEHLMALMKRELESDMPSDRLILAGFSQGGAVALHTGLRYDRKLAGILALSTYSPTVYSLAEEGSEANKNIPIMMAHGTTDPMIPVSHAIQTRQELKRLGYQVTWHEYAMHHTVCMEEIRDIRLWLKEILDLNHGP